MICGIWIEITDIANHETIEVFLVGIWLGFQLRARARTKIIV